MLACFRGGGDLEHDLCTGAESNNAGSYMADRQWLYWLAFWLYRE